MNYISNKAIRKRDIHNANREYRIHLSSGKYEFNDIENHLQQNIRYCNEIVYMEGLAESYEILGGLYTYHGNSNESIKFLEKSEDIILKNNLDKKLLVNLYNTIVVYYVELICDYKNAVRYCKMGIDLAKDLNMNEILGKLTLNMGVILLEMGEYKNGLNFSFSALEYYLAINDERSEMFCYSNIAGLYFAMEDMDEAYDFFKKSFVIAEKTKNIIILSDAIRGISKIEFMRGNCKIACESLENAILNLKYNGNKGWEVDLLLELLNLYIKNVNIEESEKCIVRIEELLKYVNNLKFSSKLYFYKSQLMEIKLDYQNAYFFHKKYFELNEKLKNQESKNKINEIIKANMEKTIKDLNIISGIGKEIIAITDFEDIIEVVYNHVNNILDAKIFGIGILESNYVRYNSYVEINGKLPESKINLENEDSFLARSIRNDEEIIIRNLRLEYKNYVKNIKFQKKFLRDKDINSMIILPLKVGKEVVGAITVQSYIPEEYSLENIESLRIIGSYAAIALENAKQTKKLKKLAITDTLTGMYNRRYFNDKLLNLFQLKNVSNITLMIIDIDYFKNINDTYGHKMGDIFLKRVAQNIIDTFDKFSEFASRIGGEEFAIVFFNKEFDEILEYGEKFRRKIEASKIKIKEKQVGITVSIGISRTENTGKSTPDILFKNTDDALYKAKDNGRNQICH